MKMPNTMAMKPVHSRAPRVRSGIAVLSGFFSKGTKGSWVAASAAMA